MKNQCIRLCCCLLLCSGLSANAQHPWIFKKEKDGIRVSSRQSDVSKFNDLKIEVDLTGNIFQIAQILLDVEKYPEWAYATKQSTLVKRISSNQLIYYSKIDVPWPGTDRDFYANFQVVTDTAAKTVKVSSVGLFDYQPVKENTVRVVRSKGSWMITTLSPKTIHLDYILELDPGGSMPAWILNLFAVKGPMETFENLKKRMIALN